MKGNHHIIISMLFLCATLAGLASCGDERPEGILTKTQMVKVMEDLYITEEKVNQLALSRDSAKQVFSAIGQKVFGNAGVSDSAFRRSFDYYMEHPKELEQIYTALVDTLQLREQRAPLTSAHP